jgi:hypothetical protein
MRIVRVHDLGRRLADDARELPRRREVDFAAWRERYEIRSFERAAIELALRVGDEHGPVVERSRTEHGQEDLVLSTAPRPRGVDVEGEHSSQSFANLRPT